MTFYSKVKCFYPSCETVIITGRDTACRICKEARCAEHNTEAHHDCLLSDLSNKPSNTKEKKERDKQIHLRQYAKLLDKLELHRSFIVRSAESLRPGHHCSLHLPGNSHTLVENDKMFGGINVHFPMVFDDGIKWLIRIRQADNGIPPLAILDTTARSEVCTLQVVKSFGLPVPGAWMPEHHLFRDEANNHGSSDHLSICYFFCEYMEGASLSMPNLMPKNCWDANEQDRKIIEDYAKHQIEMSNHPLLFTEIGCLFPSASAEPDMKTQVGPLASLWGLNYVDPPRYPGPFKPNKERYLAQIDIALSNLTRETDQNHCLNAYLWHLTLRELVETCAELSEEVSEVYVRHADDKGDILKGTEEGRITAIFDWEMAYVTTKAEAFSSPIFCYLTYVNYEDQEVYTVREHMLIEYYKKSSRPDLAECVRRGKKYQMLSTIGRFQGWYKMLCYPWALMDAFEETKPDSLRPPLYTSKAWTIYMVDRYKNDQGLQGILKELKWDLDMQKQLSHKEWEEEDAKRRHWWAMSALERTQKKRETIAAKLTRMRAKDFRE